LWERPSGFAGYNQDRAQLFDGGRFLSSHGCRDGRASARYIAHDCDATRGTSGGPLLVRSAAGWRVTGINIGIEDCLHVALPATAFDRSPSAPESRGRPR
jgi:protease YdgD